MATSTAAAAAPLSASAGVTETPVTFDGPEGFTLAGILCEPATTTNSSSSSTINSSTTQQQGTPFTPRQCALLCHGFASHKGGFHFPAIAHHLATELGLSSLRFDYTGNMDSPGPFRFASFMEEVQQMAAAKRYLEQQHSKQVVLLLGHSRGAINATLYSGQGSIPLPPLPQQHQQQQDQQQQQLTPQQPQPTAATPPPQQGPLDNSNSSSSDLWHIVPLVVLVAGRFDLTLNMHQRYGGDVLQQLQEGGPRQQKTRRDKDGHEIHWELDAQAMAERFSTDVAGACASISSMPEAVRPKVLVLHGEADPICEAADAANLSRHIVGSQLLEVPGADHWYKGKLQQLLEAVAAFVMQAGREKQLCSC